MSNNKPHYSFPSNSDEVLIALKIHLDTRFLDFKVFANHIIIFQNPFDIDIETRNLKWKLLIYNAVI